MPLVKNLQQVEERVAEFVLDPNQLENLSDYSNWYYFRSQKTFAPAKFIGYTASGGKPQHGTSAIRALSELGFRKIEPTENPMAYERWRTVLGVHISNIGGKVNKKVDKKGGIYVIGDQFDELTVKREPRVWLVRAYGGEWAPSFVEQGYVGFSYNLDEIDVSACRDRDEIAAKYRAYNQDDAGVGIIPQIDKFINEIEDGDYVLTIPETQEELMHYGIIGAFEYNHDGQPCSNRRSVSWIDRIEGSDFRRFPPRTIHELRGDQKELFLREIGRIDLLVDVTHTGV